MFFNGKIMLKKWRLDHPLRSRKMPIWKNWPGFRKTKKLWTSIRTSNSGSLPPEKTAQHWHCPIILGTGACLGHDYQIVFLSFFQWLEQRSQSQQSEITWPRSHFRYRKNNFFLWPTKKKTNPFQVPFELKSWPEVGWKRRQWIETPNHCVVKVPIPKKESLSEWRICGSVSAFLCWKKILVCQRPQHHWRKFTSRGNAGRNPWKKSSITHRY